jgi:alanyl-tRNA synthetase
MVIKTERLFESDPALREFDAKLVELRALAEGQGVVLDKTLFYPEGGGQPSDRGTLNGFPVTSVQEDGKTIVHVIRGSFQKNESVHGILDWARRFDHMQQHSGQHLLSQAFVRSIGAETMGFHLGSEDVTIDINAGELTDHDIQKTENEANRTVFEDRNVLIYEKNSDELELLPLRKRADLTGRVRIVEIEDYDWSLCCGTHVERTGEIGPIKILRHEKYKGGTRVHFVCGFRAMRDHQAKTSLVKSVSQILTAGENDLLQVLGNWREDRKASEKRIQILLGQVAEAEAGKLMSGAELFGETKWVSAVFNDGNPEEIHALVRRLIRNRSVVTVIAAVQDRATVIFARSPDLDIDVRPMLEAACKTMTAKGGGNASWAQCSTGDVSKVSEGIQKALDIFRNTHP